MIEKIKHNDELLAIIIRDNYSDKGIHFLTEDDSPFQLAFMQHAKGHFIQSHKHIEFERNIDHTEEVLVIKKGKLRVDFYDNDQVYFKSTLLVKGDIILLISGAHGFEIIEDLEMVEIKQGPFVEGKDKIKFTADKPIKYNIENETR